MIRKACVVLVPAMVALLGPSVSVAQSAEAWEMSGTMEMEGMKMPMPPNKVCLKKDEGATPPVQENCKVNDVKVRGNTTSFKIMCGPPEPMEGSGEITRTSDRMDGRYTLKSKEGEMKMTVSGRKIGACTPGMPGAPR